MAPFHLHQQRAHRNPSAATKRSHEDDSRNVGRLDFYLHFIILYFMTISI